MLAVNTCYLYILCSRNRRHLVIRATADLRHGVRHHRRRIYRKLGRRYVQQKVVLIESFVGICAAVERQHELESWSRPQLFRLISKRNPMWRHLSISGYLARVRVRPNGNRAATSRALFPAPADVPGIPGVRKKNRQRQGP